jgi:hypothetical protein
MWHRLVRRCQRAPPGERQRAVMRDTQGGCLCSGWKQCSTSSSVSPRRRSRSRFVDRRPTCSSASPTGKYGVPTRLSTHTAAVQPRRLSAWCFWLLFRWDGPLVAAGAVRCLRCSVSAHAVLPPSWHRITSRACCDCRLCAHGAVCGVSYQQWSVSVHTGTTTSFSFRC